MNISMDKDDMQIKCGRCLKHVPLKEMKLASDGKTLVCMNCRGASLPEEKSFDASPPSKKTAYTCTSCGFEFTRESLKPTRCPYCGKNTVVPKDAVSPASMLTGAEGSGEDRDPE